MHAMPGAGSLSTSFAYATLAHSHLSHDSLLTLLLSLRNVMELLRHFDETQSTLITLCLDKSSVIAKSAGGQADFLFGVPVSVEQL